MAQSHTHPIQSLQYLAQRYQIPEGDSECLQDIQNSKTDWAALGIQLAGTPLLIPANRIIQIIRMQNIASPSPVPGSPDWLPGLVSYHGELIPAIDLQHLITGQALPAINQAKLICVRGDSGTIGLLVNQIIRLCHFDRSEAVKRGPAFPPAVLPFLAGVFKQQQTFWGILKLRQISQTLSGLSGGRQ